MGLDLDRRRAERDEKPKQVTLDGDEWELPARLPLVVIEDLTNGHVRSVIAGTFGAAAAEKARSEHEDADKAQLAAERAVEKVVHRLGPLLDSDLLNSVFDELYELGDKPKKKRKEPQDHRPPAD